MLTDYLVIMIRVEKIEIVDKTGSKNTTKTIRNQRHLKKIIKSFPSRFKAQEWGDNNFKKYFDKSKNWIPISDQVDVDVVSIIAAPGYEMKLMPSKSNQTMTNGLRDIVSNFLDGVYEKTYAFLWNHQCQTRGYVTEKEKQEAFSLFIAPVIRKDCAGELAEYVTFFGGNFPINLRLAIDAFYDRKIKVKASSQNG